MHARSCSLPDKERGRSADDPLAFRAATLRCDRAISGDRLDLARSLCDAPSGLAEASSISASVSLRRDVTRDVTASLGRLNLGLKTVESAKGRFHRQKVLFEENVDWNRSKRDVNPYERLTGLILILSPRILRLA